MNEKDVIRANELIEHVNTIDRTLEMLRWHRSRRGTPAMRAAIDIGAFGNPVDVTLTVQSVYDDLKAQQKRSIEELQALGVEFKTERDDDDQVYC